MSEILIDVTRLLGRVLKGRLPTGVDRVCLAYVQHYGPRARAVVCLAGRSLVLRRDHSQALFHWLLEPGGWKELLILLAKGILFGKRDSGVAGAIFLNAGHSGLEHEAYPGMLRRLGVKPVFLVHDLIPITHPEYCRDGESARHEARMKNVLAHASGVITNSRATLDELSAFAGRLGQAVPPWVVARLAPGMAAGRPGDRPITAPYFVMLGTIEPRKNHWLLLQVWRGLIERLGDRAPRLLVIGQRGWECENVLDLLERCEQLKGYVIEQPHCTDAELVTYLHHAQALLFPSLAEGYGMPLVEALSLGVPAIASDLPAFREIAGEIPQYVAPLDANRWDVLVCEYAKPHSALRTAQLRRMEGFKIPTWAEHFATVDTLLQRLEPIDVREQAGLPATTLPAKIYACGFSYWKRRSVRQFLAGCKVVFVPGASQVPANSTLAVWGRAPVYGTLRNGIDIIRLEDGFLRSVGLGADLVRPASWVIDRRGIYFDATQPSDLEVLLQTAEFEPALLARAARFSERIVSAGLTKYNLGGHVWKRPAGARRVILVPGQVETDASLRFGALGTRTNAGLLRAVRHANPAAYVLYKPHPDVVAGLRRKGEHEDEARDCCDEVVLHANMAALLHEVDEVHTLTSLAGFEALLRGKKVTCYGQPFYAGWGLTQDVLPIPRRTRSLTLPQLLAGALLLYPRYVNHRTGEIVTPEQALDNLLAWRREATPGMPWWRKGLRQVLKVVAS